MQGGLWAAEADKRLCLTTSLVPEGPLDMEPDVWMALSPHRMPDSRDQTLHAKASRSALGARPRCRHVIHSAKHSMPGADVCMEHTNVV